MALTEAQRRSLFPNDCGEPGMIGFCSEVAQWGNPPRCYLHDKIRCGLLEPAPLGWGSGLRAPARQAS